MADGNPQGLEGAGQSAYQHTPQYAGTAVGLSANVNTDLANQQAEFERQRQEQQTELDRQRTEYVQMQQMQAQQQEQWTNQRRQEQEAAYLRQTNSTDNTIPHLPPRNNRDPYTTGSISRRSEFKQPKVAPPFRFTGQNKSTTLVSNWIFEARRWCVGNNYNPELWTLASSSYLTEYASTWYRTMTSRYDYTDPPWEVFVTEFRSEYNDELSTDKLFQKFRQLSQGKVRDKSISSYNDQFRKIVSEVGDKIGAEFVLSSYIEGLMDRSQMDVKRANPTTLQEAMLLATKAEGIILSRRLNYGSNHGQYQQSRRQYSNYDKGDPMDLSQLEHEGEETEVLEDFIQADSVEDLWAMQEDDPDQFTETVERLFYVQTGSNNRRPFGSSARGSFRGRGRGRGSYGATGSYGASGTYERKPKECYCCGGNHDAYGCPDNFQNRKKKQERGDNSGNGRGQS
jgi:hypothetical protein